MIIFWDAAHAWYLPNMISTTEQIEYVQWKILDWNRMLMSAK